MTKEEKREYDRKWRDANREKVRQSQRRWFLANRGQADAASAKWRAENPEKYTEYQKKWSAENKDKINSKAKRYYDSNKEICIERSNLQSHARRSALKGDIFPIALWRQLTKWFGDWCPYCGESNKKLTVDHVVPISKGGTNSIENLIPCCGSCNSSKGNKSMEDWINYLA